jgi:DNA-binding NtrC family response regulator
MTAAPRRVLVVEDESSQQLMYRRALGSMGFEAVCVGSPEAALAALAKQSFAIILLDLQLHGEPSLDLFEAMRDRWPSVSVVIATGYGSYELVRRAIQRDVVDFLAKPVPLGELETALDRAWSRHVLVQTPVELLLPPEPATPDAGEATEPDEGEEGVPIARRSDLSIERMERELIMEALRRASDNRKLAAEMLGISERTLYYRLTRYRLR